MPVEILMPALSPTMTEGILSKWCKAEGDAVKVGELIAEIETDKATMEVEAMENGTIGRILIPAGTKGVKINSAIAIILLKGEDKSVLDVVTERSLSEAYDVKKEPEQDMPSIPCTGQQPEKESKSISVPLPVASCSSSSTERIFASPLAKRIASQSGVDLFSVKGTGPRGRVIKSDVLASKPTRVAHTKARQAPSKIEITGLRKAIATKLTEVKQNAPHFYLSVEINVDKLLDMRNDINKDIEGDKASKISVNDLVVKAVSLSFRDMPEANLAWKGEHIEQYNNVDASVAVSVDGGIFTPIIKDADQKSVFDISKEVKELVIRARSGALRPEEFLGGSFTISNLGMYGIDSFSAILNSPQSCIFAVGAAKKIPIVKEDKIVIGNVMSVTISCDHRAVDGVVCAKLINKVKDYLESPFKLLI